MPVRTKRSRVAVVAGGVAGAAVLGGLVLGTTAQAESGTTAALGLTPVLTANAKVPNVPVAHALSAELSEIAVAQGSNRLENGTPEVPYYGYDGNSANLLPAPGDVQSTAHNVEASKTEPDKNTYLRLTGQHGADPSYDYGTHFLFQGHEGGKPGYITRVNLDADAAHRVTLLATTDVAGKALPDFDGSTWDPWAQRLLFTAEAGANGGVWQATPDIASKVEDISTVLGRGGYEGIQNDSAGNLWLVEDVGGTTIPGRFTKLPNSFVYRFVPVDTADLTKGGKLQALQVISTGTGKPITFQPIDADHPDGNAFSQDTKDLHTYGNVFDTHWVTIHDTATDPSGVAFDANAAAKKAGATPFKRPENGQFRPGSDFREFYFDETGDTDARSVANAEYGGWGSVLKLTQTSATANNGKLTLFYKGDQVHTGFDNVAFLDHNHVAFVEDAGDTLHTQRNALDSGYLFDVWHNYADGQQPLRFLAEGRDPSATIDSGLGSISGSGFQNDGDNELTGIHVSDGDPSIRGILGARVPDAFNKNWRVFYTAQHGDNVTWEIVRSQTRR
ncbi:alkaline phosphatase PhoX [Frankia sp. CIT1]|uniref:alkaline phosphatase PhoX n=1 Tax=Frankia sp. CIT1 TaxID=2880974 RepID=UPI001EF4C3CF|nr:alkaline phosphatase PhoX [Frankia sp. CIT1]